MHLLPPPLDYWYTSYLFLLSSRSRFPTRNRSFSAFSRSPVDRADTFPFLSLLLTPRRSLSVPPPCGGGGLMGRLGCHPDLLSMLRTFAWGSGVIRSSRQHFASVLCLHTNNLFLLRQLSCGNNPAAIIPRRPSIVLLAQHQHP